MPRFTDLRESIDSLEKEVEAKICEGLGFYHWELGNEEHADDWSKVMQKRRETIDNMTNSELLGALRDA